MLFITVYNNKRLKWTKSPSFGGWLNYEYSWDVLPGRHLHGSDRMIGGYILSWKEVQIYF